MVTQEITLHDGTTVRMRDPITAKEAAKTIGISYATLGKYDYILRPYRTKGYNFPRMYERAAVQRFAGHRDATRDMRRNAGSDRAAYRSDVSKVYE